MLLHYLGFSARIYIALQSLARQHFLIFAKGNGWYINVRVHNTIHLNFSLLLLFIHSEAGFVNPLASSPCACHSPPLIFLFRLVLYQLCGSTFSWHMPSLATATTATLGFGGRRQCRWVLESDRNDGRLRRVAVALRMAKETIMDDDAKSGQFKKAPNPSATLERAGRRVLRFAANSNM